MKSLTESIQENSYIKELIEKYPYSKAASKACEDAGEIYDNRMIILGSICLEVCSYFGDSGDVLELAFWDSTEMYNPTNLRQLGTSDCLFNIRIYAKPDEELPDSFEIAQRIMREFWVY